MNPLIRERRRRSQLAKRLVMLVAPVMLASAGVVAPTLNGHRDALVSLSQEQAALDEEISLRDDVMQFLATRKNDLESVETQIEALLPLANLPVDYRERTRQKIAELCEEIVAIETRPSEPITDDLGTPLFPDPYLVAERAILDVRVRFEKLGELLARVKDDPNAVVVEEFALNRSEKAFGVVDVHCVLTYLRRADPPVEEVEEFVEEG